MKKKLIIIVLIIGLLIGSACLFYSYSLSAIGNDDIKVVVDIPKGSSASNVISILKKNNLIKNEFVLKVYIKLHHINMKSGTYEFQRNYDAKKILKMIENGEIVDSSISITFVEGKTLKKNLELIEKTFGINKEDAIKRLSNNDYLKKLIDKYWFLDESILNSKLYYPLEGYLFPDTYRFDKNTSIETIVEKQLDTLGNKLEKYKSELENNSVHDILTMASIVELEANTFDERKNVAGVFYNRIKIGMSLGSDVTTYYAEQVEMGSVTDLYMSQYNALNAYNTRNTSFKGLPVGPICNPSFSSIEASINPAKNDYLYFYANKDGKILYSKTYQGHQENQK